VLVGQEKRKKKERKKKKEKKNTHTCYFAYLSEPHFVDLFPKSLLETAISDGDLERGVLQILI